MSRGTDMRPLAFNSFGPAQLFKMLSGKGNLGFKVTLQMRFFFFFLQYLLNIIKLFI
jgi:hypothetical protein